MPEVISTPYDSQTPLYACEDADPVQLTTTPSGADWTGAAVTPQGFVDMAEPFNGLLTYLYTDAAGCAYGDELQAVISPYSMGYVTIDAPGATQVCANGEAFTVHMSTLDGEDSTYTFDPMVLGPGIHPFEGVAPLQTDPPGCYQDAVITIQVVDTTHLVLDDNWALDTEGGFTLDGGAPAGGTYSGPGVTNGVFNPAEGNIGANIITYSINSGLCPGSATDTLWVSTVGLVENHAEERLELWPVPARDELFIHVPAGFDDALLTIVDAGGREVARRAVPGRVNGTPVRWDVGALANGSFGVGPEQMADEAVGVAMVRLSHDWFYDVVGVEEFDAAMAQLGQPYPSPASDVLNVNVSGLEGASVLEVIDASGRLVLSRPIANNATIATLDVSTLNNGVYSVRARGTNGAGMARVFEVVR